MEFRSRKSAKIGRAHQRSVKKEDRRKATERDEANPEAKRSLSNLFKRKVLSDEPNLSQDEINSGLNRALRTPKIRTTASENRTRDIDEARQALVAIEAVLYAMDKARDIIHQSLEIAESAILTDDMGARALLAEKYDELRLSLDTIAQETDENGAQLIRADGQALDIEMTGHARYSIACFTISADEKALNLSPPLHAFAQDPEIISTKSQLQRALGRVSRATASYCRDAKFLMARVTELSGQSAKPSGKPASNPIPPLGGSLRASA